MFKLAPPSTIVGNWNESILWSFGNGIDGNYPGDGSLIMDTSGNLYGTTTYGGAYGYGVVVDLTPPSTIGGNWNESILWSFGNGADGQQPVAGLINGYERQSLRHDPVRRDLRLRGGVRADASLDHWG